MTLSNSSSLAIGGLPIRIVAVPAIPPLYFDGLAPVSATVTAGEVLDVDLAPGVRGGVAPYVFSSPRWAALRVRGLPLDSAFEGNVGFTVTDASGATVAGTLQLAIAQPAAAPAITGWDAGGDVVYAIAHTVPLPATAMEGETGIVALLFHSDATGVTPPAGWNLIATVQASSNSWMAVVSGPVAAGAGPVTVTLGAQRDASGLSITLEPSQIGQVALLEAQGPGSVTALPALDPVASGTTLALLVASTRNASISASPALDLVHAPLNKSSARTGVVIWEENLTAGSDIVFTHGYLYTAVLSLMALPLAAGATGAEFDVGAA